MNKNIVNKIIEENRFSKRKQTNPESCPCYDQNGKKCHTIPDDELICLFCYCPYYIMDMGHPEGECKINNPQGKGCWYEDPNISSSNHRVWDCSACDYMHTLEGVEEFLTFQYNPRGEIILQMSPEQLRDSYFKKL